MIALAAHSALPFSTAFHEAFHDVYDHFLTPVQRTQLYKAFNKGNVRSQIKEFLTAKPDASEEEKAAMKAAWEAAKADHHEMMAYGFQAWHAGLLDIRGKVPDVGGWRGVVNRIFRALKSKWDDVNAWMRKQPTSQALLEGVRDGAFADNPSPAEVGLSKNGVVLSRVQDVTKPIMDGVDKLYSSLVTPYDDRIREMGNPYLDRLAKLYYTQVGEKVSRRGLVQEIPLQMNRYLNQLDQIQRDPSGEYLKALNERASGLPPSNPELSAKLEGFFKDMHAYQAKAGIKMGYVKDYTPMSWSGDKIEQQIGAFKALMERHQTDLDNLNHDLKQRFTGDPKNFEPMTPDSIATMMSKRGKATGEFMGDPWDEGGAPNADHTLDRVFSFLSNEERRPFVRDDLGAGVQRYVKQAVRKAEWVRRMGENSEIHDDLMNKARDYGMTPEQEDVIKNYKEDTFGAKIMRMNPMIRKALQINTVYQNYRVLSLATLGNLVDPFGVGIRSGDVKDAWNAYKTAAERLTASGRAKHADIQAMGETIGAINRATVQDSLSGMYGGVDIEGTPRAMSDALFKYNGMDGLQRSVRIAALATAKNFIEKHAQHPDGEEHLAELGLKPSDVHLDANGDLKVFEKDGIDPATAEKVQGALNRFVDEAAMRPNVGERTKWGANPYFAPFWHLKQYIFTFNKVINKKLEHELIERGNVTPYLMAASYIPIMSGTALFRDAILNGGTLPANNGPLHYLGSGVARSGLFGPSDLMEAATIGTATGNVNAMQQAMGPTAAQAMDLFGAIGNATHHSMTHMFAESLPGGNIAQHMVSN